MYKRILLTLDTSGFAEVAIPHAIQMTNAFDAELCLLSVVPVIGVGEAQTMGLAATVEWEAEVAHTEEYLAGVQKALKAGKNPSGGQPASHSNHRWPVPGLPDRIPADARLASRSPCKQNLPLADRPPQYHPCQVHILSLLQCREVAVGVHVRQTPHSHAHGASSSR